MTVLKDQGYPITDICAMLKLTRQAYYKRLHQEDAKSKLFNCLEEKVLVNREHKSRVGLRTIYYKENLGAMIGVNQFEKEMSQRGHSLKPYKSYMKTTDSRGHHHKYDNLVSGLELNGENQVIVGDITYYGVYSSRYYIFSFVDYYTLEVKGLTANVNMQGVNAEKVLRQIFNYNGKKKYNYSLIIHTDGGGQYRSDNFQAMLCNSEIRPSHAKNCLENGLSERLNGIIKNEYLNDYEINNIKQLNRVLKKIKNEINNVWPSKRLGYKTPKQFAKEIKGMKKKDRPIIKIKEIV